MNPTFELYAMHTSTLDEIIEHIAENPDLPRDLDTIIDICLDSGIDPSDDDIDYIFDGIS